MNPAVPLFAIPFMLAAGLAMVWVRKRLPAGWKGIALGSAALVGVSILAFGCWMLSLTSLTWGTFACTECGRVERQTYVGPWVVRHALEHDDDEYVKRFAPELLGAHEHRWHLESCRFSPMGVGCTMQCVGGWFRVLPRLKDREAADALFREAQAIPYEQRCRMMDEVTAAVWLQERDPGGIDQAFERWRAHRQR